MVEKAAQERTQTFPQKRFKLFSSQRGLSLIEVMVVVVIIVMVMVTGSYQFQNKNKRTQSLIHRFLTLGKEIHHSARLKNFTYRLVIDLGQEEEGENRKQSYWVEASSDPDVMASRDFKKLEEGKKEETQNSQGEKESEERVFSMASTVLKKPVRWPDHLLRFESVELHHQKKPILYGRVYIYFFSSGFIEEAAVHVEIKGVGKKTFFFHAFTGEVMEFNKKTPLKALLDR